MTSNLLRCYHYDRVILHEECFKLFLNFQAIVSEKLSESLKGIEPVTF